MPERPDLEYVVPKLDEALRGRRLGEVKVYDPVVLRVAVEGRFEDLLAGSTVTSVTRHSARVWFHLDGKLDLVVAPMLAGRFALAREADKRPKDVTWTVQLAEGSELRYRDDVRMGKVYLAPKDALADVIPGFEPLGIDVLSPEFTRERFRAIARKRRDQVRVFLLDKSALDSMGNAYADEVLFAAKIHPKARSKDLDDAALDRLHDAIVEVLDEARKEIQRRQPALDEKLRDFLKVRNKSGDPCPRCGARIRVAGVQGDDACFCPTCQPDSAGRGFVDWRKTGR